MEYDREFVDEFLLTKEESDILVAMLTPESRDLLFTCPNSFSERLCWLGSER